MGLKNKGDKVMSKKNIGERRKEYRHKICIDVKVIAPKTSFWALATNISGSGLEIQASSSINPKIKLMTTMQLQEEFVFHSTIVWALGDFVDGRWIYRLGTKTNSIVFRDTEASTPQEKAELIRRILPQIKAKGTEDSMLLQMFA